MRKLILFLFLPGIVFSQIDTTDYISSKNFKKVHDKYLTEVMIGDPSLSTLSSYVSIDITKPSISMAATKNWFNSKDTLLKGITTFKFNGSINDGIATVFSNEKFNSDITFRVEHNIPIGNGATSMKYIKADKKKLDSLKLIVLQKEKENEDFIKVLELKITGLESKINKGEDSLKEDYFDSKSKLSVLKAKKFNEEIDKLELEARWTAVRMVWINTFAQYGTQKIRLYDSEKALPDQITKITPDNYEYGLGLNLFYDQANDLNTNIKNHWASFFNGLYSISYSYAKTNNTSELISDKIVKETQIGQVNNDTRFIENSINAYLMGSYDTFKRHKVAISINKKIVDNLHFHVFYDHNKIKDSDKFTGNYQNLGLGFVLGLRKKDDPEKKTYVNFEPFVLFNDLDNKFKSETNEFYKRSLVGIRTTIPFDNLLKK